MDASREHRLKRLRELRDRLERMPASAERDRMLQEVRARVVDVDTGVTPRPMLPADPPPVLDQQPVAPVIRAPKEIVRTRPAKGAPRAAGGRADMPVNAVRDPPPSR